MQNNDILRSLQANRRPNVTETSARSPRDSVRFPQRLRRPYDYRTTALRFVSERRGTPYGHTGSVRYPLKICGYLRLPDDHLASLYMYQNVEKRLIKKSYDARMNCKNMRLSPHSPTMSKNRRENRRPKIVR